MVVSMSVHSSVRIYVPPKRFSYLNEIRYVYERYTTVCRMTWSKVKVKVTEVRKLWKRPIYSSTSMHVIKRPMVNY